ncbi:MAG: helix-turn-helix transcriptional regulator [Gammaproteobacteria bacterium]|nr:helix-turn-helix transcriptional regulator [Gammaproteobacteria bacterium]
MAKAQAVVEILKKALKASGLTYADVARHLGLSQASIKRMFARGQFTLERLESICAMMHLDFTDLVRMIDEERAKISSLTSSQEEELVSDLKFLLIALCVQNAWTFEEIVGYYNFPELECIRYLIRLDRLGLIELLPNNRIRRMVAQDFRWLPRGPIERFFEQRVQRDFLKSHFSRAGELRLFLTGMLSKNSLEAMRERLDMIAREFSAMQRDDSRLPAGARFNAGLMLSVRPWELRDFAQFRRRTGGDTPEAPPRDAAQFRGSPRRDPGR